MGTMGLDGKSVDAFLKRIGAKRPRRPTSEALRELQRRHILSVPYETIDLHWGRPMRFGADAFDKIVRDRRGGVCYELNGLFCELLRALGYEVTVLGGRVVDEGRFGPVLGHMVMRVLAEDSPSPWLVDVGYGHGFRLPLRFDSRAPQQDPHGSYRLVDAPYGDVDLYRGEVHQYRVETRPRVLDDFQEMAWYFETAADSPVLLRLYATMATEHGRVTIIGNTLIRRDRGQRGKEVLGSRAELLAAYREHFGFQLDRLPAIPPRIRPALVRLEWAPELRAA